MHVTPPIKTPNGYDQVLVNPRIRNDMLKIKRIEVLI